MTDTPATGSPTAPAEPAAATQTEAEAQGGALPPPGSLASDAWRSLRRNPFFVLGVVLLVVFTLMALFPRLFSSVDANDRLLCDRSVARQGPGSPGWFGYDDFGCDYYAQVVYGARVSLAVGFLSILGIVGIGVVLGALAGWTGGWVDTLLSRFTDIWFGLPLILGAILLLSALQSRSVITIAVVLALLAWMTPMRLVRGGVLQVKEADYVAAATALGASRSRILLRHVLPNSIASLVVYATITIGVVISAEATLSFLGVGLPPSAISWGVQLSEAQDRFRTQPFLVLFPGLFLSLTVLSFMLIGDALRDALDPRLS